MSEYESSASSSAMQSSEGSSGTSGTYSTTESSSIIPPSQLKCNENSNRSTTSTISDPSATTSASNASTTADGDNQQYSTPPCFSTVMEETASALEDASRGGQAHLRAASTSTSAATIPAGSASSSPNLESQHSHSRKTEPPAGVSHSGSGTDLPPTPVAPVLPLECDYDVNPTALYQAIESKNWEVLQQFFEKSDPDKIKKQAATWVTRKETNGKLRWRLLPIHAAVIFQAPVIVVQRLLHECPEAAQAKDDQGMLPLHLAFRTKQTCWETVEELITSHPQAISVKDRKGRIPLECGLAAATAAVASASDKSEQPTTLTKNTSIMSALTAKEKASKAVANAPAMTPTVQKAIFSVMELYTQISVQEQVQTCMTNSRKAFETRIGNVQDNHVATLTQLKKDWENQRNELGRKIQGYKREIQTLKSDFNIQQELLEEKCKTEMELVDKLQQVTTALEHKTVMDDEVAEDISFMQTNQSKELGEANKKIDGLKKTNKDLLLLLETLLDQQNSLKMSLEKLSWDTNAKDKERQELLDKYFSVHQQSMEMSNQYTEEWQKRLEKTNQEISAKLANIVSQNSGANAAAARPSMVEKYDGEEKKAEPDDGSLGSKQDP